MSVKIKKMTKKTKEQDLTNFRKNHLQIVNVCFNQSINTFIRAEMKQTRYSIMTLKIQHQGMAKMTMRSSKSTTTCYMMWKRSHTF